MVTKMNTCFGSKMSGVQITPPRPIKSKSGDRLAGSFMRLHASHLHRGDATVALIVSKDPSTAKKIFQSQEG